MRLTYQKPIGQAIRRYSAPSMGDIDTTEDDPLLSNDRSANGESLATAKTTSYGTNGDVAKVGEDPAADSEASKPSGQDEPMFEGLPEVKKRLKYILPPIAVGIFLSAADQTIVVASSGKIGSELESLNNTSWIASALVNDSFLNDLLIKWPIC